MYYKDLKKKQKRALYEGDEGVAEVVSGEEFEEDEEDIFYLQIQRDIQIMDFIKEIEPKKAIPIKEVPKLKRLAMVKRSSLEMDDDDQIKNSMDSPFTNSSGNNEEQKEIELLSCVSNNKS